MRGVDAENLYYIDENEHLYQVNKQNGNETRITDQKFSSIHVDENWIYYLNSGDNYHLYKMKKNGEDNQLLVKQEISDIHLLDNWIYSKIDGNQDIYRVKTDGTENRLFSKHI
ncbi:DUF5050 domain-containing protein [Bacillus sp. V59.32b]|uniref:DUF5050 domain-containing protein n=1 Tax=Bacillus sp. V59.32b TaxID=1758642 RepID=UPI00349F53FF